jgi:membrane fusion protein, copper/silver efflux system
MLRLLPLVAILLMAGCSSPDHHSGDAHDTAATDQQEPALEATPVAFADLSDGAAAAYGDAIDHYLHVSTRLAADTTDGVSQAARALADALERMAAVQPSDTEHARAAIPHARALAEAASIDRQRDRFGELSPHVDALARSFGPPAGAELHRFVCGMADAPEGGIWLQREREPRNPYFGAAMLRCARTIERVGA